MVDDAAYGAFLSGQIFFSYRSVLGPLEAPLPLTFVLRENGWREEIGVDVATGPADRGVLLPKAAPDEPRFKLADLLTGILLPPSSIKINNYITILSFTLIFH